MLALTKFGVRLPDPRHTGDWITAVDSITLPVAAGQTTVIVGETGAGKSMLLAALIGLLPPGAQLRGTAHWAPTDADLTRFTDHRWRGFRGHQIGWWSQHAQFTPTRTVRSQLVEAAPQADLTQLAQQCHLPAALLDRAPHQLSGGELRRAAAIAALLHAPALLLADEPTAGLGPPETNAAASLLDSLRDHGQTNLVVTHDLDFAERIADTVAVMRAGQLVEHGPTVLTAPNHPYSRALVAARAVNGYQHTTGDAR